MADVQVVGFKELDLNLLPVSASTSKDARLKKETQVRDEVQQGETSLGKRLGIKGRDLFQPVRAALTGRTHGPELPLLGELLGRERCIARLRSAGRGEAELRTGPRRDHG